jgi:hypothetical protein
MEMVVTMLSLAACGVGLGWLFYDIERTYKAMEDAYKESTLGKEDEQEEE